MGPVDEVAGRERAARGGGNPLIEERLAQLFKRVAAVMQPRREVNRREQLGVGPAVARRKCLAGAEPAREVGPESPAGVGHEVCAVGVLDDARERHACPALEASEALVALLENTLGDEPRAQIGGRLSDVVFVEQDLTKTSELDALIADYLDKARRLGYAPMAGWF